MSVTYRETVLEVLAVQRRWNRWREALERTDRYLADLEELNLKERPVCEALAREIVDLAFEYQIKPERRLPRSPSKTLDLVFEIQVRLFRRLRRQRAHQLWLARSQQRRREEAQR